jgi:VanZ family protein
MVQVIFIAYVLLVIFVSLLPQPAGIGGGNLDKIVHVSLYFVMGVLAYIAFNTLGKRIVMFVFMLLLGISLELFQKYIPGRDASIYDALANASGLALSFFLCWLYTIIPDARPPGADKISR